ncbi:MAG TPA: SDR family NAD(P)-dependent oxidoreductase, partial [Nocardioidaceae bacterium]|nr:SDR family NAD(P)-dependent oxidoreductase [Nocardioidaceae bacterium]
MTALAGKVVVVTGGARGIGYETAAMLLRHGARVAVGDIDEARLKEAATELRLTTYGRLDVTDPESFSAFLDQVEAELGPVEVLVNNAGITRDAPFHKMSPQQWHEVIDTNLTGLFNMTHVVWGGMRDRKFGRVVSISSINGQKGQFAQANYAAAKAGDIGFTKALALEGARAGITVNVVAPGYINTDMMAGIKPEVMQ